MKIAHLTTVHPRYDTRIFLKQCRSLATHSFDVTLIVADGKGDEFKDKISIVDVGLLSGRLNRILKTTRKVLSQAIEVDADIYHLHDPELIPVGLRLKHLGKKVIFDSHEDIPKQILAKPYLTPFTLRVVSVAYALFERHTCSRFDGVIAATPFIRDKFLTINKNCVDINNFPLLSELDNTVPVTDNKNEVCYVGSITSIRGIREMVQAFEFVKTSTRLNLGGSFHAPYLEAEIKSLPGWSRVNELGFLDRAAVRDVLGRSIAGLVTLHPVTNYLDSLPVKMFEYMAAGIPVIASNFPIWQEIIESNDCGICINPLDPTAIATAIDFFINTPERAKQMGANGKRAVLDKYNWNKEEGKLISFYKHLLTTEPRGSR